MSRPFRATKRPVTITAIEIPSPGDSEARMGFDNWAENSGLYKAGARFNEVGLIIPTLEGDMFGMPGSYVIVGVNGEFYPCAPDIFAKTYQVEPEEA